MIICVQLRENIKAKVEESSKRAAIFKASARRCMVLGRKLDDDELDEIIASVKENEADETKKGRVVIAGAGCGAYDLITVRALNAVKAAEVIVYDDLIDERLLEYALESCEKIYVGKRNERHSTPQQDINELLLAKANEGKYVVRLKGGDPYVFGRGAEEIQYLNGSRYRNRGNTGHKFSDSSSCNGRNTSYTQRCKQKLFNYNRTYIR